MEDYGSEKRPSHCSGKSEGRSREDDEYRSYFDKKAFYERISVQLRISLLNKRMSFSSFENSFELIAKWIYIDPFISFHFLLPLSQRTAKEIVASAAKTKSTEDYIDLIETLKRNGYKSADGISSFLKIN